jgi:hypothetical protein
VWVPKKGSDLNSRRVVGPYTFVPLATAELRLVAALEVTLLRPEPAGRLITQAGDIDNRLKTSFDALAMPQPNALPDDPPAADEDPLYVVFEDDNLTTDLRVQTEHLLTPNNPNHAELFIRVHLTPTSRIWGNMSLL